MTHRIASLNVTLMLPNLGSKIASILFLACLGLATLGSAAGSIPASAVMADLPGFLENELKANFSSLQKADSLRPYFLAYRLHDTLQHRLTFNKGGMVLDRSGASRGLQVELRVGNRTCDNTHPLRDALDFARWTGFQNIACPLDTNSIWLRNAISTASDFAFRAASDQYLKIAQNLRVRPMTGDTGLDFSATPPLRDHEKPPQAFPDRKSLDSIAARLKRVSRCFRNPAWVFASSADFNFSQVRKIMVTSEGASLEHYERLGTISLYVETKAEDGMVLWLARDWSFRALASIPDEDSLTREAASLILRLDSLRQAPIMETYSGPVLLRNTAAAVFVHEVFGHRVEGHRQRAVDEGQTFVDKVGRKLTLASLRIEDDPTAKVLGNTDLNGYYQYDDEGVKARRTPLLWDGVFKDFLFGRSVISPHGHSNGHGRARLGENVVARMGNTRLSSSQPTPINALRDTLITWLKRLGKPYGLMVHELSGGYTYTGRDLPQTFKLEPLFVTQIFADGRPDRLVRGVDVVGTPLQSLSQIVAAGDDPAVFNGHCGAESGWLPVSAISPSLLLGSMEFESRGKDQNRPPILAPPGSQP
jgi:TldD protein